jgi:hypothetical protein
MEVQAHGTIPGVMLKQNFMEMISSEYFNNG